jgi:hypothetical protein
MSGRKEWERQISQLRHAPSENTSTKGPQNCRSLGFARDDKGKGNGCIESGGWTEAFFITSVGHRPMTTPVGA